MVGKPCDRCGAFDGKQVNLYGDGEGLDEEERESAMCAEVHVAFGLISWLCHNCRKEYHRFTKNHPLDQKYSEATLRLEFWKARIGPDTPQEMIDDGIELLRAMEALESGINESANRWLISDPDEIRVH